MFKFLIGFCLGIYVSLYGVSAIIDKFTEIFSEVKQTVEEKREEHINSPDISV